MFAQDAKQFLERNFTEHKFNRRQNIMEQLRHRELRLLNYDVLKEKQKFDMMNEVLGENVEVGNGSDNLARNKNYKYKQF